MTGFEWHTAEEDEAIWPDPLPEVSPARRLNWPRLLLALILAVGLAAFIQQRVQQHLVTVQAGLQAEITATGNLLREAAAGGDVELFTTLLSGRDMEWAQVQQQTVARQLFLDRPALNLHLQPYPATFVTTTINAELQAAEQNTHHTYAVKAPDGATNTIALQQTTIFRQGTQSWLFSPPEEAFWGPWQVAQANHLMISYRERDEALIRRLLADLDNLVADLCAIPAPIPCRPGRFLWVRFSPEPDSLLLIEQPEALVRTGRRLVLPTPSLVGLPVDESGYQALLNGYASFIAARVVARQVQWQCCRAGGRYPGVMVYQALLREYLHRQELIPQPGAPANMMVPSVTAARSSPLPAGVAGLPDLWAATPAQMGVVAGEQAQVLITRLLAGHPQADLLRLMRGIGRHENALEWYQRFFSSDVDGPSGRRGNNIIHSQ